MNETTPTTAPAPRYGVGQAPDASQPTAQANALESVNLCQRCNKAMRGRAHRRYCSDSCRTLACRARRRATPALYPSEAGR